MLLEDLIKTINSRGFIINNLFQTEDFWQANLHKVFGGERTCFEFGQGVTPAEALSAALAKVELSSGTVLLKSKPVNYFKGKELDQNTINDILSQLNLGV